MMHITILPFLFTINMNYHALSVTNIIRLCIHRKDTNSENFKFMLGNYINNVDVYNPQQIYEQLSNYSLVELRTIMYLLTPFYGFNKNSTSAFSLVIKFIEDDINNPVNSNNNLIIENKMLKNEINSLKTKLQNVETILNK